MVTGELGEWLAIWEGCGGAMAAVGWLEGREQADTAGRRLGYVCASTPSPASRSEDD